MGHWVLSLAVSDDCAVDINAGYWMIPELVPFHTDLQISSTYLAKKCLTPKIHSCQCDWGLAIKNMMLDTMTKAMLDNDTALQNAKLWSSWGFMDWMLQTQGSTGWQQFSVIAGHFSLFIHYDCRVKGTLGIGRKKPRMIKSSQSTQGFLWLTRSPLECRVLQYEQPQACCGCKSLFWNSYCGLAAFSSK